MRKFILTIVSVFVVLNFYAQEKNVAVIAPFDLNNNVESGYETLIKSKLTEVIAEAINYKAFTRTDIDAIIDEHHFQQTGMVKEEDIKKIGKMTGATHICVSELDPVEDHITLTARIINIETGEVETEKSKFVKAEPDAINKGSIALANKLMGKSDNKRSSEQSTSTFIDKRDGQEYEWVKIGDQVWMEESLNYDEGSGCWCYDDISRNCAKYGRLYNWETAKKVCPEGWHLPMKSEFETLLNQYGGEGEQAYIALKCGGSSGFSALFGGLRGGNGLFGFLDSAVAFWASSEGGSGEPLALVISSNRKNTRMISNYESNGFYVRCVKD